MEKKVVQIVMQTNLLLWIILIELICKYCKYKNVLIVITEFYFSNTLEPWHYKFEESIFQIPLICP